MRWEGHTDGWPEKHRPCVKCRRMLPFSSFHKHKDCVFGINTVCKLCRKPLSREQCSKQSPEYKLWHSAKSRAKIKGLAFDIEQADITIPEVCPILGVRLERRGSGTSPSLDRINPELGYIKGNVWVISNKANMMKSNASREELLAFASWVNTCEVL